MPVSKYGFVVIWSLQFPRDRPWPSAYSKHDMSGCGYTTMRNSWWNEGAPLLHVVPYSALKDNVRSGLEILEGAGEKGVLSRFLQEHVTTLDGLFGEARDNECSCWITGNPRDHIGPPRAPGRHATTNKCSARSMRYAKAAAKIWIPRMAHKQQVALGKISVGVSIEKLRLLDRTSFSLNISTRRASSKWRDYDETDPESPRSESTGSESTDPNEANSDLMDSDATDSDAAEDDAAEDDAAEDDESHKQPATIMVSSQQQDPVPSDTTSKRGLELPAQLQGALEETSNSAESETLTADPTDDGNDVHGQTPIAMPRCTVSSAATGASSVAGSDVQSTVMSEKSRPGHGLGEIMMLLLVVFFFLALPGFLLLSPSSGEVLRARTLVFARHVAPLLSFHFLSF